MHSRHYFLHGGIILESYGAIIIELTVGLFGLLLLTKIMGRSSLSEATPLDLIAMIVVGDFVSEAIYDPETSVIKILFSISFWGFLIYLIDLITLKFHKMRAFIESSPAVVIHGGKVDREVMRKNRMDMNHLQMLLREREIFSIREVDYAILETNGKVSVIRSPDYQFLNRRDSQSLRPPVTMSYTLISDGIILDKNLSAAGKSKRWLKSELQSRSIQNPASVMLAEWRKEDGLYVQTYEES